MKRMFPSYTTEELKSWSDLDPETAEKVRVEIARRESGESVHGSTPQVDWHEPEEDFYRRAAENNGRMMI